MYSLSPFPSEVGEVWGRDVCGVRDDDGSVF